MRTFLLPLIPVLALPAMAADPPVKRGGGFFGFGAPPAEQISAGLFPEQDGSSANLSSSATRTDRKPASDEGIFRTGEPQRVAPVSYVIENGRRVERPVTAETAAPAPSATAPAATEKPVLAMQPLSSESTSPVLAATNSSSEKKRGFLGFGKKGDSADENPVVSPIPPVPAAAPMMAATPVASPPPVAKPTPRAEAPATVDTPAASNVKVDTPEFAGVKAEKEKSSWIPFLGRKKHESEEVQPPVAAAPMVDEPVAAAPVAAVPAAAPAPTTTPAAAKPTNEVATYEIRRDESKPAPEKKEAKDDREGGILTPITKIKVPRKEIDLTGAETIIANGEIVKESGTATAPVAPAAPSTASGPRQAPQVVNGVKTYSSWDDVNARTASAADRIIGQMR